MWVAIKMNAMDNVAARSQGAGTTILHAVMNAILSEELMHRSNRRIVIAVMIFAALLSSACQQKSDTSNKIEPTNIRDTGETLYRVRLTANKADEYNIQTTAVREARVSVGVRKVIPSVAVVNDQHGNTWMFTNPEPLVFVRNRIRVDYIEEDLAVLSDGPPAGTAVVTVGADKLFSGEFRESGESSIEKSRTAEGEQEKKSSGMATMQEDGTVRLVYRTAGAASLTADIVIQYKPTDDEYQKILDQVGGLRVGETKFVPALPE